jgi:simple sugar transport system ATP-binding protein
MAEPLVEMRGITKHYGRIQALTDGTLTINRNEIVGLLGDNGAGKSTLIKVLSGAVPMTSGEIRVKGRPVEIRSTNDAIANGIETIYQDLEEMNRVASELLRKVGITKNIPPTTPISALSGGERQAVAIARAMYFESDLIILDEPTNNLGVAETQGVLKFVRDARDSGHSCIFIAHNIHHVFKVVDRIVVMRRGRIVADDLSPRTSTIDEVEDIITGEHEAA